MSPQADKVEAPELKPCPFCGGDEISIETNFDGGKYPVCVDCGATCADVPGWNRRAALHPNSDTETKA